MQPIPSENPRSFPSLSVIFILNAVATVSFSFLAVFSANFLIALGGGMYLPAEQIGEMETLTKIAILLSSLGIADAIVWIRGKSYAGLLMVIYSILHFGLIVYFWVILSDGYRFNDLLSQYLRQNKRMK